MYSFIILLLLGFGSNLGSTFTWYFSMKFGGKAGTFITILLRDIFGIPVWAIGFVMAVRESSELIFQPAVPVLIAAWLTIVAGAILILAALLSIKGKAAAPSGSDSLVSSGLYSYVRHPVHCGTLLEFIGVFLFWPSVNMVIACLVGIAWIILQSRLEEDDLKKRIPEYSDYMKRVPPFLPSHFSIRRKHAGR